MQAASHRMHRSLSVLLVLGILLALVVPGAGASINDGSSNQAPLANDLRISQVFGGGGGTGYYLYDYVELFNAGTSLIDLTGYSLQYGSATGQFASTGTNLYAFPAGTTVAASKYLLVQLGAAGTSGLALPTTPDLVTTNLGMSQSNGKVALANIATALGCGATATPCSLPDARIVDLAAWGTSNNAEGGVTINNGTALTNQQGGVRKSAGCQDTDHNGNDFDVLSGSALVPRNSSSPANPCGGGDVPPTVVSTVPANGATSVAVNAPVSVTFSEPVTVSGTIAIDCTSSGIQNVTPTGGPTTFALPHTDFAYSETCTVTILASQVTDQDGTPNNMAENYVWSFSTAGACGSAATPISTIQGTGAASPVVGSAQTIEAMVIADYQAVSSIRGFFVQEDDADTDADPATSEGLFIYDNNLGIDVAVGDLVRASGFVSEFQSQTQLSSINAVTVCPTPLTSTPVSVTLPFSETLYPERFEGMSVVMTQTLTVNETFNLGRGSILTLADGRLQQPTNVVLPGAPANALQALNNLNQITLDDGNLTQNPDPIVYPPPGLTALNTVRSGDSVSDLAGVFTQGNPGWTSPGNLYRINPYTMPTFTASNPRPPAPDPVEVGGSLKVSSFNVLNYFITLDDGVNDICGPSQNQECRGADSAVEFTRQRDKMLQALNTLNADVVGLMELENTPGVEPLQDIVNGLNALTSPGTYDFIDAGTILPGDHVIKVGLIYKPAVVQPLGPFALLDITVDPNFNTALNRPALAQTFEEIATNGRFTAVVNHLKSKSCTGAIGSDTDQGDGQSCFNYTRTLAANALATWAAGDPTGTGDPDVLMMGDLNSYARENPMTALEGAGYTNLEIAFEGAGAYSYVFASQAGSLDHSLANASLFPQVNDATTWHINADEPGVLDYNTEFKTANQINILYNADAYRTSDHDPLLIGLNLTPTAADMWVSKIDGPDPVGLGETLTYTITSQNNGPDVAQDVVITDTLPAGLTFNGAAAYTGTCSETGGVVTCDMGDIANGAIESVVISATVSNVACGAVITNTVEVASATPDSNPNNNSSEEDTTVSCRPPNIFVAPLAIASTQAANTQTQHTLTISNTGQADLTWTIAEEPVVVVPPVQPQTPEQTDWQAMVAAEMSGEDGVTPATLPTRDPAAHATARRLLLTTGLLLIPDSTNDRVMAFDPTTGNLVDADFIPADPTNLSTPKNAILSASGDSILVADQVDDVVQEYDLDGNYLGVFAPAGGANTAILDNITGIDLRPNGNLLVAVQGGANADSVAEFDTSGNYLGNFVANAAGGLDGPFDVYPRTADWLVPSINTDNVLSFDLTGAPLGVFAPSISFGQQVAEASNSNVLVSNFSTPNSGVLEYTPAGVFVGVYSGVTGNRGVYELPNGNILTTNGSGVHEIDRLGNLIQTKFSVTGPQYIEYVEPSSTCSSPADIPWVTVTPGNGTTAGGAVTGVTITLDSTSLASGTYTGNLCITSNDPDAGPGNETDLVIVPVTLTVEPPTALTLSNVAAVPAGALPVAALPLAGSLALLAAYWLRRKR